MITRQYQLSQCKFFMLYTCPPDLLNSKVIRDEFSYFRGYLHGPLGPPNCLDIKHTYIRCYCGCVWFPGARQMSCDKITNKKNKFYELVQQQWPWVISEPLIVPCMVAFLPAHPVQSITNNSLYCMSHIFQKYVVNKQADETTPHHRGKNNNHTGSCPKWL